MAAGNVTSVSHSDYRPTLWASDTLDYRETKLVIANTIDRTYDSQVSSYGQAITIEQFLDSGEARDKADNGNEDVVFDTQTDTPIVMNIDKHKYKGHNITAFLDKQSKYELRSRYTKDIAHKLSRAVDVDALASIVASGVASGFATTTGAGTLNISDVTDASTELLNQNIDFSEENVTLLVGSDGWKRIVDDGRYSSVDFVIGSNGKVTTKGQMPMQIAGASVVYSPLVPAGTAYMYAKECATLALQKDVSFMKLDNPRSLATELVGHNIYGTRALRTDSCVTITLA